jgi:hypothetical protein
MEANHKQTLLRYYEIGQESNDILPINMGNLTRAKFLKIHNVVGWN